MREQRLDDSYVSQQLALGKKKDLFEVASELDIITHGKKRDLAIDFNIFVFNI